MKAGSVFDVLEDLLLATKGQLGLVGAEEAVEEAQIRVGDVVAAAARVGGSVTGTRRATKPVSRSTLK